MLLYIHGRSNGLYDGYAFMLGGFQGQVPTDILKKGIWKF